MCVFLPIISYIESTETICESRNVLWSHSITDREGERERGSGGEVGHGQERERGHIIERRREGGG